MARRMPPPRRSWPTVTCSSPLHVYEMLGWATDAEDVLQETWLRWVRVDLDTVRDQRAYLAAFIKERVALRESVWGLGQPAVFAAKRF